jgi:Conserved hypothetical protein (DUF2461)
MGCIDGAKVFRVYRDIRFSPDPTPYKVKSLSVLTAMFVKLMTDSPSFPLHGLRLYTPNRGLISGLTSDRSRTGRKGPYAGYYVQIAPGGKSFVGT